MYRKSSNSMQKMLQCVVVYSNVLQCVSVCSSVFPRLYGKKEPRFGLPQKRTWQRTSLFSPFQKRGCCSVLQCVAGCYRLGKKMDQPIFNGTSLDSMYGVGMINRYMGCVAACCSVLQRVAACCSVLHCVADYDE